MFVALAQQKALFWILLLVIALTTGCFSRGEKRSEAETTAAQTAPTHTPTVAEAVSSTAVEPDNNAAFGDLQTIEEITTIERYRMRIAMESDVPNRGAAVQVEAAYIKEPSTEEITIQVDDNGETQVMTMYLVDGLRYMRSGEMVVQTADARMNLQELTLIQPSDISVLDSRYTEVGVETINGRDAIHYQGDSDAVPTGGTAGDRFDVTTVESARIDLWVDQAERFIVAMEINVTGFDDEPEARLHMRFDYYDFNSSDIVIDAPDDAMSLPGGMPGGEDTDPGAADTTPGETTADAPEPRNALGKLLGFDLLLATGSEITALSSQIVQVKSVYTLDEAVNLFQTQLPPNGYALMSSISPQAGETVLMFQKGMQVATIQLTATDNGSDWNVVMAP